MSENTTFDRETTTAWAQKILAGLDDKAMNFFEMELREPASSTAIYDPEDEAALAEATKAAEENPDLIEEEAED